MTRDRESGKRQFSDLMFQWYRAEAEFEDRLVEAGFPEYEKLGGDWYDSSIEFYEVVDDASMSDEHQRMLFDEGFSRAWLNHKNGWETYYSWDHREPFKPSKGSRQDRKKAIQ